VLMEEERELWSVWCRVNRWRRSEVGEDREKYKYPTALNGHLSAALRTPGVALPHSPNTTTR
jgi:hypothetical protein